MLELEAVNTYRGRAQILQQLSLTVGEAESVCLVGRNGAGKTTTIDSIIGLLPIRSGKITFRGKVISGLAPHLRARHGIGYAPEDAGLAEQAGVSPDERIYAVFPEVKAFTQRRALNLSGGQKKMVAIAWAMALLPSILLLDEPFEGLAPVVVTRFIEAVKKIKGMGISVLIAESNLTNARRVADRLYAIDRGEIIYAGDPGRVFENEDVMKMIRG